MGEKFASEAAEKLAAEHDLDAEAIEGSGQDGAITKADVEAAIGDDVTEPATGHEIVNAAGGWRPIVNDAGEVQDEKGGHYCPGCGLRYGGPTTCTGTTEGPHPPIETAPVAELAKAGDKHTAAPASGGGSALA